ncbi:hypothetical protein ACKWTF_006365 [Chironomus riparius]
MSRLLDIQPKQALYIGTGVAISAGFAYAAYNFTKRVLDNRVPKKWRKVGEVTDLICYPIKSCGWIRTNEFNCSQIGIERDNIRDRVFMVVRTNGEFITARAYPTMVQVTPVIKSDIMTLSAPGMRDIKIDIKRLFTVPKTKASVWSETVDIIDAGEEAAQWFSRFILKEDFGLRLVFYPQTYPTRGVREKNKIFDTTVSDDTGALHDATSFMLINEGSIADLNSKINKPVTPLQFRPNIVIKGPNSFEEDSWKWVRIGNHTVFRNVKPCTRCIFTNIDPETARRSSVDEPLKTLKKYRQFEKTGESPVMGIHLGIREYGALKLGDSVFVEDD